MTYKNRNMIQKLIKNDLKTNKYAIKTPKYDFNIRKIYPIVLRAKTLQNVGLNLKKTNFYPSMWI